MAGEELRRDRNILSSQTGMTLVEVVISVTLLGIAGVGFLTALSTG